MNDPQTNRADLESHLVKTIKEKYVLIPRGRVFHFLGGFLAVAVAVSGISFLTARQAISTGAGKVALDEIDARKVEAGKLVEEIEKLKQRATVDIFTWTVRDVEDDVPKPGRTQGAPGEFYYRVPDSTRFDHCSLRGVHNIHGYCRIEQDSASREWRVYVNKVGLSHCDIICVGGASLTLGDQMSAPS